ncbi:PIG-L deacetylase family protein [Brevibacillus brevis]|uniref:PIG-L deacetylase family protein n=1 Tax=Brevibacillus brevis TaxID=1393 RepID=UPI0037CC176A
MKNILIIAPHPDDETLGCGGTLLKHKHAGDNISWLIMTTMDSTMFSSEHIQKRQKEIQKVAELYGFQETIQFSFKTTQLDTIPMGKLVTYIGDVFRKINPDTVYLPYRGDAHSDHKATFDASVSCIKWFRYPSVKKAMVYETLSETDFGLNTDSNGFRPNIFSGIDGLLDRKIEIMKVFESEIGEFPFPRSEESIRALAALRGTACGCKAAEAFMLLKEVI